MHQELYKSDIRNLTRIEKNNLHEMPAYLRILMVMSIRDSSFIISFSPHSSETFQKTIQFDTLKYYYRIDLIDLDIKLIEKLEKYISEIKIHG